MKREQLLPLLVFMLIEAVLSFDVIFHDPTVGYDAPSHLHYVATLAQFELPDRHQTVEFFSPPLPYVIPALVKAIGGVSLWWAGKAGQLMNLIFSIGLCWCVLKICDELEAASIRLQFSSLALLAIVPVYYKSFSMVRGEPLLALMVVASVYWTLRAYRNVPRHAKDFAILGVLLGLAILSRQWAFLIFPPLAAFALLLPAANLKRRLLNLQPLLISFAVAALVGGWFYLSLDLRFGSFATFSRKGGPWSLSNQPERFYSGLGLDSLFSDPIRPAYANEFIPTFYSEFWGDYQCYFVVYGRYTMGPFISGRDLKQALDVKSAPFFLSTNRYRIGAALGRAQALAMVPSLVFLGGLVIGTRAVFGIGGDHRGWGLIAMVVASSLLGYLAFVIRFPKLGSGDIIKATYMLQVVPLLAMLGAKFVMTIEERWPRGFLVLAGMLALSGILNAPFLFTRYVTLLW